MKSFKVLLFLVALSTASYHEYISIKYSEAGIFVGKVVEKAESGGRSNTKYFGIVWENGDYDAIIVHPITYQRYEVGDNYRTQLSYVPLLGAGGGAYAKHTNLWVITFLGWLSKIYLIIISGVFCINLYNTYGQRFTGNKE